MAPGATSTCFTLLATQAAPSLEVDDTAFSLLVSTLSGAGTSSAPTRSPCSWSGLGKVVVARSQPVPNGYSEGIMWARVVNRLSSTSDNPTSVSKGRSAFWMLGKQCFV